MCVAQIQRKCFEATSYNNNMKLLNLKYFINNIYKIFFQCFYSSVAKNAKPKDTRT